MIPVCTPTIGAREKAYVLDCLKTNWISSSGSYLSRFEEAFSRYCQCQFGISATNGTTALHLALAAINLKKGDEIIMPSFSIASTAFAAMYCGAKPVFVDIEPDTGNIDPKRIEEKITKRTKAIMPIHIYGHPCDMDPIMRIAKKHKLFIIEDAAESHGALYKNKKVGSFGDMSCFSFYANKIITTGEGGMVVTNNKDLAKRCQSLRNLNFIPERRYWHEEVGFNYRMTNIQAALGLAQFESVEKLVEMRRTNAKRYNERLKNIPGIHLPVERKDCRNVYWMYGIRLDKEFGCSRDQLMQELKNKGVETRTYFLPLHQQPFLKEMGFTQKEKMPVTEAWAQNGLYIPSSSHLRLKDLQYVCDMIRDIQKSR